MHTLYTWGYLTSTNTKLRKVKCLTGNSSQKVIRGRVTTLGIYDPDEDPPDTSGGDLLRQMEEVRKEEGL
jgi:hypothetical protein